MIATTTLILLINQARPVKLKVDPFLTKISEERCINMKDWSHNSYYSFYSKQIEKKYKYSGEILAKDFPDATSTVTAWLNSPSHKEILTAKRYTKIGCTVCNNKSVCLFGGNNI